MRTYFHSGERLKRAEETDDVDEGLQTRRDLLKTAGRFAAYTPPAVMVLLAPSRETFAQSGGGGGSDSNSSDSDSSN